MIEFVPLPGDLSDLVKARLVFLYRFAWETVGEGEDGDEPRDLRAWDLARGWFQRDLIRGERWAARELLRRNESDFAEPLAHQEDE